METLEDRTLLSATSGGDAEQFSATDLDETTPDDLAQTLAGPGVEISNVEYTGSNIAAGTFEGGNSQGLGIESGVILSTGDVADAAGPNQADNTTTVLGQPGDEDADAIVGSEGATVDATVLEFDFVADSDFVTFTYVFASEEYNEFAGSEFNDAFAFIVNGENVALLPDSETPVTINTVNSQSNSEYFNNNDPGDLGTPTPYDTEYDGFTTPLTATVAVTPGEVNHIKLVIADTADPRFDSAVFIAAESFVSAEAELSVSMDDNPDPAVVGQSLEYAVTVQNDGPDTATGVVLTDQLPEGMEVQSVTIERISPQGEEEDDEEEEGGVEQAEFVLENGVLVVDVGELEPGETAVITINVTPTVAGIFTNFATVSANEVDSNSENNTAQESTFVIETGAIEGLKFHDLNANGVQDEGEPGLAGFTIQVLDSEGEVVGTAVTRTDDPETEEIDETGTYSIGGLPPGAYAVVEVQQDGWVQSAPDDDGEHHVTLQSGETITDVDFGNFQFVTIEGFKFHDLNGNGVQDEGEPGLAGVTIEVLNSEGAVVGTAVTQEDNPETEEIDETGTYVITGLPPGAYTVAEVQQQGWEQSAPVGDGVYEVTLQSGETAGNLDFGNFQFVTIEGFKFHDLNANGVQDEGEPGLAGVTIEVLNADGEVVATAVTQDDDPETEQVETGTYVVLGLLPGAYFVREVQQPGFLQSFPDEDGIYSVDLLSGEVAEGLDFGNYQFYGTDEDTTLDVNAENGVLQGNTGATATLVEGPQNGTLTLNEDGSFTYEPDENFNGFDSFEYEADDGSGVPVVATVIIGVLPVNDAPVAGHDSYRADAGGTLVVTEETGLLANDTDADGDELSVDVELVSGPSNGTLELNPDGTFTYTPNEGFTSGVDSFTYMATDGELNSEEVTVTINVNDPAFNDFADEVDQIVRETLIENGLDPDTKELGDEAVNEEINAKVLVAYEEFLENYEGDEDFSNVVIVWLDPADFVLTDSEGRSTGFTEGQGQSNEIDNGFYSGNGDVEVLIIADAGANPYELEVSGTGGARGGANFITPDGVSTVTFQDTLVAGETLVVALDPAEASGAAGGLQVTDANAAGEDVVAVGVGTDDLALADDVAAAVAALQGTLDAENQSRPDLDVYEQIVMWIDSLEGFVDDVTDSISDAYEDSVLGQLLPLDWLDGDGEQSEQQQALLDLFWAGVGRYLLGPTTELINLAEFLGDLMPESQSDSQDSPGEAPPEVTGEEADGPARDVRKEALESPREARDGEAQPNPADVQQPVRSTGTDGVPRRAPDANNKPEAPVQPA